MKSEAKLPGFTSALSREQSILFDSFCYKDLLSFDYTFSSKNLEVSLDASCKGVKSIRSGINFDLASRGFTASLYLSNNTSPSLTLNLPSKKFNLSRVSESLFSQNSSIRPSCRFSLSSSNSQFKPSATVSAALSSKSFKAKVKGNDKRITANCTFGTPETGAGLKTSYSLKDLAFNNYSAVGWYCEDLMSVKLNYLGYFKESLKNRLNVFFFYQMFDDISFASKFTSDLKNETNFIIGWEGKLAEKTWWKLRATNKAKFAFVFNTKVLNRTKTRLSFEVNLKDFNKSRLGIYFSFHAESNSNNVKEGSDQKVYEGKVFSFSS